jgi:protein-S-isoprenylcysteine O-methyltransferase Ste14
VAHPFQIPTAAIEAKPSSAFHNVSKTLAQVVVMWSIFLLFLPKAISQVEDLTNFPKLPAMPHSVVWTVFWCAGLTGMYSGLLFAIHGRGTPLPLDATTRFLVLGPYRCIRNPMATLGVIQVLCVAFLYRSPLIILYGLIGAVLWNQFACPWEEADLAARFGQEYEDYRRAVHNWVPHLKPYRRVVLEKQALAPPKV